jgi:hypothetical protein
MLSRAKTKTPTILRLELLEDRLVLSGIVIHLDPVLDRFGDQIVTVQGYKDGTRTSFGVFDTGSSAITFSAADQARFTLAGIPIPIRTPDGAVAKGIGGRIVGDVSEPDAVWAGGLTDTILSWDANGHPVFTTKFSDTSAVVDNVQVFVGTESGSPNLPTILGTPILMPSSLHPDGRAALMDMSGATFDFSPGVAGLTVSMPGLQFVNPSYHLQAQNGSIIARIPMSLRGGSGQFDANGVTEAPNPVQDSVNLISGTIELDGKKFLFDTGAQMSVVTPQLAAQLMNGHPMPGGVDYVNGEVPTNGVGGPVNLSQIIVDSLEVPSSAGKVKFTNVPLVVSNLDNGLDGILGMNLFNSALAMLYNPYGGSSLEVMFPDTAAGDNGPAIPVGLVPTLGGLGVPFVNAFVGNGLPVFSVASGQIQGRVFLDNNTDGSPQPAEGGVSNAVVYIDANNNGQLDSGEEQTTTDANGNYRLSALLPGAYTVRVQLPPGMKDLTPGDSFQVNVSAGEINGGWNFSVVPASSDGVTAYVAGLYGSILDRVPDAGGLAHWSDVIRQGTSRDAVARSIWESPEHRGLQVDRYYAVYLQRAADPAGRAAWVRAFQNGAGEIDVQRGFLTSNEYQANHGGDNAGFLAGLYVDIFGRTPDVGGQAFWLQQLNNGVSRAQVVQAFFTSEEGYRQALDRYYADFLNRAPDDSGVRNWVNALLGKGTTLEAAGVGFLASQEFYNLQLQRIGA